MLCENCWIGNLKARNTHLSQRSEKMARLLMVLFIFATLIAGTKGEIYSDILALIVYEARATKIILITQRCSKRISVSMAFEALRWCKSAKNQSTDPSFNILIHFTFFICTTAISSPKYHKHFLFSIHWNMANIVCWLALTQTNLNYHS